MQFNCGCNGIAERICFCDYLRNVFCCTTAETACEALCNRVRTTTKSGQETLRLLSRLLYAESLWLRCHHQVHSWLSLCLRHVDCTIGERFGDSDRREENCEVTRPDAAVLFTTLPDWRSTPVPRGSGDEFAWQTSDLPFQLLTLCYVAQYS